MSFRMVSEADATNEADAMAFVTNDTGGQVIPTGKVKRGFERFCGRSVFPRRRSQKSLSLPVVNYSRWMRSPLMESGHV